MAAEDNSWRTQAFRQSIVSKIDEAIQRSGTSTSRNSVDMENHVFQKAKTYEEYLGFVARLILHIREISMQGPNTGQAGMQLAQMQAGQQMAQIPGQVQNQIQMQGRSSDPGPVRSTVDPNAESDARPDADFQEYVNN